ncbi:MAG TPA: DUF4350 domain-containing protein, partial [Candidatus Dormibacteraeota bacterium]|nr:DUF4350 domain-containing protein [Candidatus Dormibacteraeota bacterium]
GGSDQNDPSSRSAGRLGTLALYTWFQDLGLQVHRVSGQFDMAGTDVLLVYDPTVVFTDSDVDSVKALLRGGGDIVLVTDASTVTNGAPLLDALGAEPARPLDTGVATPAQLFDSTQRVRSVPVGPGYSFGPEGELVPLLQVGGDTAAGVIRPDGSGRAYLIGTSLPLSNDGLRHDDSAWFALSLLQRARGGRIAFDEVHHGEGSSSSAGAGAIFNGPIGLGAVLLAAVVVLALGLNGRRLGAARAAADTGAIPRTTGYLAAMANLFSRTKHRGPVAARYADELKRRLGEVTGVDPHLDDATFVAMVTTHDSGQRGERLRAVLAQLRALQARDPDERALLQAARDVDDLERQWLQTAELRP